MPPTADPTAAQLADEDAARATIRAIIDRTNAHDPSICTDLFTLHHVETTTGKRGAEAIERCRKAAAQPGLEVSLVGIHSVRIVDEREALVQFTSRIAAVSRTQVVRLLKDGGHYKLDGDGTAEAAGR
jgi:hypothetical protein